MKIIGAGAQCLFDLEMPDSTVRINVPPDKLAKFNQTVKEIQHARIYPKGPNEIRCF